MVVKALILNEFRGLRFTCENKNQSCTLNGSDVINRLGFNVRDGQDILAYVMTCFSLFLFIHPLSLSKSLEFFEIYEFNDYRTFQFRSVWCLFSP